MPAPLQIRLGAAASEAAVDYHLAGRRVIIDRPLPALAPFLRGTATDSDWLPPVDVLPDPGIPPRRVTGWVAGHLRAVTCRWGAAGCRLHIAGVGTFTITRQGHHIALTTPDTPAASERTLADTLLGPVLTLALSMQHVYTLHASAVLVNGEAIALLGESGAGKSTLAAYIARTCHNSTCRLADDALPVTSAKDHWMALSQFPQLKLPPDQQPAQYLPDHIPLRAIHTLDRPAKESKAITVQPLPGREAAAALLAHTQGARLFSPAMLADHLAWCSQLAASVPAHRLRYPRTQSLLPRVAVTLTGAVCD